MSPGRIDLVQFAEPIPETFEELAKALRIMTTGTWVMPELEAALRAKVRQFLRHHRPEMTLREEMLKQCIKVQVTTRGTEALVDLKPWAEDVSAAWEETWAEHTRQANEVIAQLEAQRPLARMRADPAVMTSCRNTLERRALGIRESAEAWMAAANAMSDPLKAKGEFLHDAYQRVAEVLEGYLEELED